MSSKILVEIEDQYDGMDLNDDSYSVDYVKRALDYYNEHIERVSLYQVRSQNAAESAPASPNTGSPKLPTKRELWNHLRGLPVPPIEVLLGSVLEHYVNAAHDFICRQLRAGA